MGEYGIPPSLTIGIAMKITVVSDLHLEFGTLELVNKDGADVLILSGDICVAVDYHRGGYVKFFEQVSKEYKHVIYVMGNHEHYSGDFVTTYAILKEYLSVYPNIHLMEKETITIDSVKFIVGTMWTDMNGFDTDTLEIVNQMMSDFRVIKNSNRYTYRKVPLYKKSEITGEYEHDTFGNKIFINNKMKETISDFSTLDAVADHKQFIDYLKHTLDPSIKNVVVTHHAPSSLSIHPKFSHDTIMNGGYRSVLDLLIEDHPEIVMWTHGHMHDEFDYTVGSTRVVCNPRGYIGHEIKAYNFVPKTFKL